MLRKNAEERPTPGQILEEDLLRNFTSSTQIKFSMPSGEAGSKTTILVKNKTFSEDDDEGFDSFDFSTTFAKDEKEKEPAFENQAEEVKADDK